MAARLGIFLSLFTAVVLVASATPPAVAAPTCRLLNHSEVLDATEQPAILDSEISSSGFFCRFQTGKETPKQLPEFARRAATLQISLHKFTGPSLVDLVAGVCVLAHKGYYSRDACENGHRAIKADDPLRRFKLMHASMQELGGVHHLGGFHGDPAFIVNFDPPLDGSTLWLYDPDKKSVMLTTCIDLARSDPSHNNAHFFDCAEAAAHGAFIRLG